MMSAPFDLYDTENWDRKTSSNVTSMLDLAMAKTKLRPFLSVTMQFFHSHDMKRESIDAFKKPANLHTLWLVLRFEFLAITENALLRSESKQNETGVYIRKVENSWGYDPWILGFRRNMTRWETMFLDLGESFFCERSKIKMHPVFRNWWNIRDPKKPYKFQRMNENKS